MPDSYYKSRYVWNNERAVVWKEIVSYLSIYLPKDGTILDIGAGYCDFINNVNVKNKIALDYSADFKQYAKDGVKTIQSQVTNMNEVFNESVDVVFASNLLEHLSDSELVLTMSEIKRVLKKEGRIILMQPNYRLSYKTYFDDPTHKKVFSDVSLQAFLISYGFQIELSKPRFLPFSMNSKPSVLPFLNLIVRAYLYSPFKPFAGQMLLIAKA